MKIAPIVFVFAGALLCGAESHAQFHSEGPLLGAPLTMLVDTGTAVAGGVLAPDRFHRKRAGFGGWLPEGPPLIAGDPVFSTTALFGGGVAPPAFEINAFSAGLDEVLATTPLGGVSWVAVPPGAWGAVSYSVKRGTPVAVGTVLEYESTQPDGLGADIFSWMLPGSAIPPSVAACYPTDRPQRAMDSAEMGLFSGASPGEISAFDIYAPMYQAGPPLRLLLPGEPTVFFSVSHDAVFPPGGGGSLVPGAWFGATPPSAATILCTQWSAVAGAWMPPTVHLGFAQLGLGLHDDIDALAVDLAHCKLLFSIVDTPTSTLAEQLQVAQWTKPVPGSDPGAVVVSVGDYRDGSGGGSVSAAERAGLAAGGDIDGVCTVDPGEQLSLGSIGFGSPVFPVSPKKVLGSQAWRDEALPLPTVTAVVSNLPPGRFTPPRMAELWLGVPLIGGGYALAPDPLFVAALDGSNPSGLLWVPLATPALAALASISVDLIWVVRPAVPKPSAPVIRIII